MSGISGRGTEEEEAEEPSEEAPGRVENAEFICSINCLISGSSEPNFDKKSDAQSFMFGPSSGFGTAFAGEAVEGAADEVEVVSGFAGAAVDVGAVLMAAFVSPSKSKSFRASN